MALNEKVLAGLTLRSEITTCPIGSFSVQVVKCSGRGDCSSVCPVYVFERDREGRCVAVNDFLCFGCMACVAQCSENGIVVRQAEGKVDLGKVFS